MTAIRLLCLLVLAPTVLFAATPRFPELEVLGGVPPGYRWEFENGPDFYVYRALSSKERDSVCGVYFGTAPSFSAESTAKTVTRRFADHEITWHLSEPSSGEYHAEALLPYKHDADAIEIKLHIWVIAPTVRKRDQLMSGLSKATIRLRNGGHASNKGEAERAEPNAAHDAR